MIASYRAFFFFSSRRRHTRLQGDWSSDVCSSDLPCATSFSGGSGLRWHHRRPAADPFRRDVPVCLEWIAAVPGAVLHGPAATRPAVVRALPETRSAGAAYDLPLCGRATPHLGACPPRPVQRRRQQAGLALPARRLLARARNL